ncbi:APC family permease [Actinotalea solisilvae]|uniref:APC family permease n=1 Tax=Actinotalea solisilvae TaxID=2072922 RepID=UPI0018F1C751|nr:APC family permease [Actinotalea solisilvae]
MTDPRPGLARRLGLLDATAVGVGSMLGAGVFVAFAPAAAAAGPALPVALLLAAVVAWLNADSSARLAAVLPTSGGAYAYGRARLSPAAGTLAGAAFLVGKSLSAAAIATTAAGYAWPEHRRVLAVGVVVALTAAACAGARRGARATLAVSVVVLATLAVVAARSFAGAAATAPAAGDLVRPDALGVLGAAGILFFAFAGYARVATLGEEVRDPARTLPRAIAVALAVVLVTYALVGAALVRTLGLERLAVAARPVADAAAAVGVPPALVVAVATLAALASCLGVLLGLSRTALAMARDGVLPRRLARLDGPAAEPRPVVAQGLVGLGATAATATLDLTATIALSSGCVLVYYAVAHAAALTLPGRRGLARTVPVLGLVGCLVVAVAVVAGAAAGR